MAWRELVAFAVGLVAFTFVLIHLNDGAILFSRPLRSDEIQTVMVASHSSPAAVVADLMHGADHGPPLLHLVVWGMRSVAGSVSPRMLHAMALICVLGAVVLVYATLRRRFNRHASVAGALAVGSHILVITHAFEGRYYGPWLLSAGLFAWSLSLPDSSTGHRRRDVIVAVASILLCTIHWFGVISLALMCGGAVASHGRRWRQGLRLVTPSVAGLLVLIALLPLAVRQGSILTVSSWLADFTVKQLANMAAIFWVGMVPAFAAGALVAAYLFSARRDGGRSFALVAGPVTKDPSLLALAALALMPLALVAISLVGTSATFPRYAIVATLAWAPLVGVAMQLVGRWPSYAFTAFIAALWFSAIARTVQWSRDFAIDVEHRIADLRHADSLGIPTVFQSMHIMYAVTARDWPRRSPASFLELSDSTMRVLFPPGTLLYQGNKASIVKRDVVRVHAKRYGYPRMMPQATLDTTSRFLVVFDRTELPEGYTVEKLSRVVFPRHRLQRVGDIFWYFERMPREPKTVGSR